MIAYFSVRKADEPPDESHPYGHEKVENVAAGIEGMLILVGAGIIIYEAVRRLIESAGVEKLGVGIAVIGFSVVANVVVSTYLYRQARITDSPALEGDAAHLRTDAFTSAGVLVALVLVEIDGRRGARCDHGALRRGRDRVGRGADHSAARAACSWTRRCPRRSSRRSAPRSRSSARTRWSGSTSCGRAARGRAATSTSTSSSGRAPRSSARTSWRTSCSARSAAGIRGADVLIHLEPEESRRD